MQGCLTDPVSCLAHHLLLLQPNLCAAAVTASLNILVAQLGRAVDPVQVSVRITFIRFTVYTLDSKVIVMDRVQGHVNENLPCSRLIGK